LLVYAVNSRSSFGELEELREKILRVKDMDWFPIVLVGNKADLTEDVAVTYEEGYSLAKGTKCLQCIF
jgi:GTPase KRas protein